MDLNRVEWSRAQDLLLQLVQILSPLADRDLPPSFFLNKRFLFPTKGESASSLRFRHPVRLLTTLHSVQKEVEEIIGEEFSPPLIPEKGERKAASAPVSKEVPSHPENKPEKLQTESEVKKEGETKTQKAESTPPAQKNGSLDKRAPSFQNPLARMEKKTEPPLSKQAQKLILQVQDAISKLCSSTNIKDPKEEPLREALRRLKPNLDRIIEVVTHEEMHLADEGLPPFRFALPRSPREDIVKKLVSSPEAESEQKTLTRKTETTPPIQIKRSTESDAISNPILNKGKSPDPMEKPVRTHSIPAPVLEKGKSPDRTEKPLRMDSIPAPVLEKGKSPDRTERPLRMDSIPAPVFEKGKSPDRKEKPIRMDSIPAPVLEKGKSPDRTEKPVPRDSMPPLVLEKGRSPDRIEKPTRMDSIPTAFTDREKPVDDSIASPNADPGKVLDRFEKSTIPKWAQIPLPASLPVEKKQTVQQENDPKPIERTSLPVVPFVPLNRQLTPARKKKKRKGFWFRGDDEERNNS